MRQVLRIVVHVIAGDVFRTTGWATRSFAHQDPVLVTVRMERVLACGERTDFFVVVQGVEANPALHFLFFPVYW